MRRILQALAVLPALLPFTAAADEKPTSITTKIHIALTLYIHRTTPVGTGWTGTVLNEIFLELSGHNVAKEVYKEVQNDVVKRTGSAEASLGTGYWRVVGPHKLQRVDKYPQNVVTVDVEVTGSKCKALWRSTLLPGFTDHILPSMGYHDLEHYENPHMIESVCTITIP